MSRLLDAALAYAHLGYPVIPLDQQKAPRIPKRDGGNGFHDATTDRATIKDWWIKYPDAAGIGIPTGSGTFDALDIDPRNGGHESYVELASGHDDIDRVKQHTGSGGFHLLFKPTGLGCMTGFRPGIDLKANGGYIVVPPSLHPSGKHYKWDPKGRIDEVELPEMPGWLLGILQEHRRNGGGNGKAPPISEKIPSGSRNDALASMAGTMRHRGASQSEIEAALLRMNVDRCDPPLPESEVRGIAASITRYPAAEKQSPPSALDVLLQEHRTNLGDARRFVALFGHDVHYCFPWRKWLVWDGGRFDVDETGAIFRLAKQVAQKTNQAAWKHLKDDEKEALAKHALNLEKERNLRDMLSSVRSESGIPIEPKQLDRHQWLLPVENGVIDLKTGELLPHSREYLFTKLAPASFDPEAECPTFTKFLEEILPKVARGFVQRALGASLTGVVRERVLIVFWGEGANGKSTLMETFSFLIGGFGCTLAASSLMVKHNETIPNDIAQLRGARFVVAQESEQGQKLATSLAWIFTSINKLRIWARSVGLRHTAGSLLWAPWIIV